MTQTEPPAHHAVVCGGRTPDKWGNLSGPPCGRTYHDECPVCHETGPRHLVAVVLAARAAGWRVSPTPGADGTYDTMCPTCAPTRTPRAQQVPVLDGQAALFG